MLSCAGCASAVGLVGGSRCFLWGCCWYFFSFILIPMCFYPIFRSVKKFSFEGIKLVISRVDAHLTHLVPSLRSFLLLTRSSPVPYTNLVSSDATHTLLHDQQTRRISGLLVSQGRSAVRRFSRSVMPWRWAGPFCC